MTRNPALLSLPQKYVRTNTLFRLKEIAVSSKRKLRSILMEFLEELPVSIQPGSQYKIEVFLVNKLDGIPPNFEEAYQLSVSSRGITTRAISEQGVYWAIQTLCQLTERQGERYSIQGCEITDWPAFRIREFMRDVGWSYISMEELKREIEVFSRYKVNVFHWHLTENQAWCLESKIFPVLSDGCNMSRMPGKYYTIEEAEELARFHKEHNVLPIPEVDMPEHSAAFTRVFRHDMQGKEGMAVLKLLMDGVCGIFEEVPYLHIGTNEVEFTNSKFIPEMVAYIRAKGRQVISWNPGWKYEPDEIDMEQMWSYRGKMQLGIPAIDSRFHYINHFDTFVDLVGLYISRIYNEPQGSHDLAGMILAVRHDRVIQPEDKLIQENNLCPNLLAITERLWSGGGYQYLDKNRTMSPIDSDNKEHKAFVSLEQRILQHKEHHFQGYPLVYVKQTNVRWHVIDPFPNDEGPTRSPSSEGSLQARYTYGGENYGTHNATGADIYLHRVWGLLIPGARKDPQPNHTAYVWTWIHSPKVQGVGTWIEFQNYSRSEMGLPPTQEKWDYKGSRIRVNDQETTPLIWIATHREKSNEVPLGGENCVGRKSTLIHLERDWDKVLIKLPVDTLNAPEVRPVKRVLTFVCITPDREEAVEGLTHSPDKQLK